MNFREEGEIGSKSREKGEIGSESREKVDLPPCFTPLCLEPLKPLELIKAICYVPFSVDVGLGLILSTILIS